MKNTFYAFGNPSSENWHARSMVYIVKVTLVSIIAILLIVLKASC